MLYVETSNLRQIRQKGKKKRSIEIDFLFSKKKIEIDEYARNKTNYSDTMFDKMFEFNAAVRGYHYYQRFWQPVADETLQCGHEDNNPYDFFAIKVCSARKNGSIVGHLPMEIRGLPNSF